MVQTYIINGLIGGLLATIVMTAFMMALGDDSPPPTALFWSKYVGDDDPSAYMMQGMALHFLYGIGGGAVFGAALWATLAPVDLVVGLGAGLAYGIVLFVVAAVFWMNVVLGMDADPKAAGMFLFFHLVYGGILGAIVGFGPV